MTSSSACLAAPPSAGPSLVRGMRRAALLCLAAGLPAAAIAADVGLLGPTYPIAEQNFLTMIEERLHAMEVSGKVARLMDEAAGRARTAVETPASVQGLVACVTPRTYYFDPSVTLSRNIFDGSGRLLFAAGTRKNPLDMVALPRPLLFFDARDARQRDKATALLKSHDMRLKLILTGGSYLGLMRQWRTPIYFDQQGLLSQRLGLKQVPALVSQEGRRLRIDEIEVRP